MSLSLKLFLFIIFSIFNGITSDSLVPCSAKDGACLKILLANVKNAIVDGIPEFDIPKQHYLEIHDVEINVPETIEFNITDGVLNGLNSCVYVDARINIENGNGSVIVQCDLVVRGIYNAIIWKPKTVGVLVNNQLKCDGPFEIILSNIEIKYNVKFSVKSSDGDFYIQFDDGSVGYDVNSRGHKVVYALTGIYSGTEDVTETFNKAVNKNWKPVSTIVIGEFLKAIIATVVEMKLKYLSLIPVKKILTNDVGKYAIETEQEVNQIKACPIKDAKCQLELIRTIKKIVTKGVPELNIPKLDVIILKNLTVQLPELMDFTLLEGSVSGADKCTYKSAKFDFDARKFTIEQYCDLIIKGNYVAYLYANATLTTFGGQNIQAHGNTEVKLVKLPLTADYEFLLNKKSNGDIFLTFQEPTINYDFNEPGHSISFKLDGVILGSLDISEIAMNILNDNWQFFAPDFGPTFVLAITRPINHPLLKYLSNTPTTHLFVEPL